MINNHTFAVSLTYVLLKINLTNSETLEIGFRLSLLTSSITETHHIQRNLPTKFNGRNVYDVVVNVFGHVLSHTNSTKLRQVFLPPPTQIGNPSSCDWFIVKYCPFTTQLSVSNHKGCKVVDSLSCSHNKPNYCFL